ncbi:MAG: M20/M25/M40 family metallo-hydrolase [Pyrinomonadaceae bacterium]|nr:M20/M25/M40 family metallo-hydrolase [Pyrinomonadaceae bacterium]
MDNKNRLVGIIAIVSAIVLILILMRLEGAPTATVSSEAGQFSVENALRHVEKIANAPHPVGSENHLKNQEYIRENLGSLGIDPETQTVIAENTRFGMPFQAGYVTNISGTLKGNGNGEIILISAHYDSVSTGAGAADDAAAVGSILETLRILKSESSARNDIMVLFTDAEEKGMLGAKAFLNENPNLAKIKTVINLEARGTGGAALLFETSENNAELIRSYGRSVARPIASSFFNDIYKILPNDTDFTEFKLKGIDGLNTAFIENVNNYHTQADNPKNLDRNSVAHQGENLLAVVRELRNKNFDEASGGEVIYFDVFGMKLLSYPKGIVLPLMIVAVLLFVGAFYYANKTTGLNVKGFVGGFFLFLLFIIAELIFSFLLVKIITVFHRDYSAFSTGDVYDSGFYIFGVMLLVLALAVAFFGLLRTKINYENLLFGSLLLWLLISILTSLLLPGTSYIFTLTVIIILIAGFIGMLWVDKDVSKNRFSVFSLIGSFGGIILVGGILRHLIAGLGFGLIPVAVFFAALLIGLLIPALASFDRKLSLIGGGLLSVIGVVLIVSGLASVNYTAEKPRQTSLLRAYDADNKKSYWATEDINLNEWNKQLFDGNASDALLPQFFPQSQRYFLVKESAEQTELPAPSLEKISDETVSDVRNLRLKLTSPTKSPVITLAVESENEVVGFELDGKKLFQDTAVAGKQKNPWMTRLYAIPAKGSEIVLSVKPKENLKIRVITQDYGLPQSSEISINNRPADLVAAPMPFNDSTFVTKLFVF